MSKLKYFDGDVFQFGHKIRRVVGTTKDKNGRTVVVYSTGGNKNRYCQLQAFRKFERKGKLIHAGAGRGSIP